jgi:hypothetical protein
VAARRKAVGAAVLIAAVVLLTGCTPTTSAFIRNDDEGLLLTAPEECGYSFAAVEVRYSSDNESDGFEDLPLVWTATAEPGAERKSVRLFDANDGYETEQLVTAIDTSREMVVWWTEAWGTGSDVESSLIGILDEVDGDNVLWSDGIGSHSRYESQMGLPWGSVRC